MNRPTTNRNSIIISSLNINNRNDAGTEPRYDDETIEEIMRIAKAFREAHDEDTRVVMNVQSSKNEEDTANLFFYAVSGNWMRRAWPFLNGKINDAVLNMNWREDLVGQILNYPLLVPSHQVVQNSTDNMNANEASVMSVVEEQEETSAKFSRYTVSTSNEDRLQSKADSPARKQYPNTGNHKRDPLKLISNLKLNHDFFLLGPNVWFVVKNKFGFDIELPFKCRFVTMEQTMNHEETSQSTCLAVMVLLQNGTSKTDEVHLPILIPPTGRFRYEEFLNQNYVAVAKESVQRAATVRNSNNQRLTKTVVNPQEELHPDPSKGNNVSDDDDEYDYKALYDEDTYDDMSLTGNRTDKEPDIILLPPSTTSTRTTIGCTFKSNDPTIKTDGNDSWLNRSSSPILHDNYITNNNRKNGGVMDDEIDYDDENDDDRAFGSDIVASSVVPLNVGPHRLRPYGSGLGNLGNTCFMNSTLQCLAHTEPLRSYFLSGEYEQDLNRDNPLGTGGELAIQFSKLLTEMYVIEPSNIPFNSNTRTTRYSSYSTSSDYLANTVNVVYPKNFKVTLGRHAEQFIGYDQHDSQELATYLLDALHEDTNRVTTKPYIEKPEQAENETDEMASKKAWSLHLKRENSRVLEFFMGLVKSRVECCEEGCGRVSTTFDPVMYLSVPIPGSSERIIQVTYVPLEPLERPKNLSISLPKAATVEELLKKLRSQLRDQYPSLSSSSNSPLLEDLCPTDIFQKDVHTWYTYKDDIEKIRENDLTFVYELRSSKEIRQNFDQKQKSLSFESLVGDDDDSERLGISNANRPKYYCLDLPTLTQLNHGDKWSDRMRGYLTHEGAFINAFNPKKGSTEERVKIYRNVIMFLDDCYHEVETANPMEECASTGQKRTRDENLDEKRRPMTVTPDEVSVDAIIDICNNQNFVKSVKSRYDLAVIEFLASKMRKEILDMESRQKQLYPNGIIIQICIRLLGKYPGDKDTDNIVVPFVLRIPSDMTVYGLRQEIAKRLKRSLRRTKSARLSSSLTTGQSTAEVVGNIIRDSSYQDVSSRNDVNNDEGVGEPELLVIRQVALSYVRRNFSSYRQHSHSEPMGSVAKSRGSNDSMQPICLASPMDHEEKALVSDYVGNHDRVYLDWSTELMEECFDMKEFESVDDPLELGARLPSKKKIKTVLDCIDKFCQKEQLEETEQWYCNKCQKHVRAWKQFHIYKSPPHLIVHLKRFQYSPTTHRRNKINVLIDFPLKGLDLTKHVSHWSEDEHDKPIYDCYAVTNHFGGLGGGHYTAYAVNPDGVWCLYDDSRVTSHIDPKEVVSQAAYVLYYRRRDVPTHLDFVYSPQTSTIPHDFGTSIIVSTASPALIQNDPECRSHTTPSSEISSCNSSSSNAAMIGDEDDDHVMNDTDPNDSFVPSNEVVDDNENPNDYSTSSGATSPMGSTYNHEIDETNNSSGSRPTSPLGSMVGQYEDTSFDSVCGGTRIGQ